MGELEGRGALITGGSRGLGLAIAREYLRNGASVVLAAREASRLEAARLELEPLAIASQRLIAVPCDVSKPDEVSALVERAVAEVPTLDVLVNCAGVYGPMGRLEDTDWLSWVQAVEINLYGAVLLCRAMVPHFKRLGQGKIVLLSGGGATAPLPRFSAYAASKAAVVRFAETLAVEVAEHCIDVSCIAPGALNTRLLDEVLAAGPRVVGQRFYDSALKQKDEGGASLERAAALAVFLGSKASDGITGRLISAVWDPWEQLAAHRDELVGTDLYTLRRIVPKDRGKGWGG